VKPEGNKLNPDKIGVIISTYNNPEWLKKTLWGYLCQTRPADEIIIADDGSREDTRLLIESFKNKLPIKHVWHEDNGFRKTEILNKALVASTADYLVFTDQDCVPRADFLETHERYAQKGYFLSGGYFRLTVDTSQKLTQDEIVSGEAFGLKWFRKQKQPVTFKFAKLINNRRFSRFMNIITPAKATWNGCNSSGWRTDLLYVNGFNEDMKYGGEDREFGERLMNWGIKAKQIRYSAILLHLDHPRPYKNREAIAKNLEIRRNTRKNRVVKTSAGIEKSE
jgi:glycosyltransferase involved in cell wall biosynthesis